MGAGILQTTVSSCTPTATGRSIAQRWMWHYRVPQGAFERLELLEGKLSRAVLRGLSGSNLARLPGIGETCSNATRLAPTQPGCWRGSPPAFGLQEEWAPAAVVRRGHTVIVSASPGDESHEHSRRV